jgi:hypothetical protein
VITGRRFGVIVGRCELLRHAGAVAVAAANRHGGGTVTDTFESPDGCRAATWRWQLASRYPQSWVPTRNPIIIGIYALLNNVLLA